VDLVPLPLVDHRAERHLAGGGVAHRKMRRLAGQGRHVVVVDGLMDQIPARGHADLALVQEGSPGPGGRRAFQIDVIKDDQRGVAAEFQVRPLKMAGRQLADTAAHGGGAGEGDDPHERIGDQGLASIMATRQHVQQPVGQPGLLEDPR
jgi:hypothetical protein